MPRWELVHGAATYGGQLNRTSLRCRVAILGNLLPAVLLVLIDHGENENWGITCHRLQRTRQNKRIRHATSADSRRNSQEGRRSPGGFLAVGILVTRMTCPDTPQSLCVRCTLQRYNKRANPTQSLTLAVLDVAFSIGGWPFTPSAENGAAWRTTTTNPLLADAPHGQHVSTERKRRPHDPGASPFPGWSSRPPAS